MNLPSFFQDNPWLDILTQRGAEPSPDFVSLEAPAAPAVSKTVPFIEPEPTVNSPTTSLAVSIPKELIVRLEVSPEIIEAIREFKEAIVTALSISQHQATIIPIYIPISVTQMTPQASLQAHDHAIAAKAPTQTSGEVLCPKCGRPRRLIYNRKSGRAYVLVLHGRQKCYLGPEDVVKVKWPSLAERSVIETVRQGRARILSPSDLRFSDLVLPNCQTQNGFLSTRRWSLGVLRASKPSLWSG